MIEITLNTGLYFTGENYFNKGLVIQGVGFINSSGLKSEISLNGKVLHETIPEITTQGLTTYINNSGEFYLSNSKLSIETGDYKLIVDGNLEYEFINTNERHFYKSHVHQSLITGFSGVSLGRLSGQSIFLNGQKLTSGSNYIEQNGNFIWIDPDNDVTGILFSISNRTKNDFYISGIYDVIKPYNKDGFSAFLNGIKLTKADFLQMSSILQNKIETGRSCKLRLDSGGEKDTIFL